MTRRYNTPINRLTATLLALALQACSAGSGGGGSEREFSAQASTTDARFVYDGAPPASEEVQAFKVAFYDPLAGSDRCGGCHTPNGSGSVHFTDQTNVNRAWQEARNVVNLDDPRASAVVQRVASGHNCWLGATQTEACASTITGYIERWAAGAGDSSSTVKLLPRRPYNPSGTRVLPASVTAAVDLGVDLTAPGELLELLNRYCADCHSDTAANPQTPYFGSDDVTTAYEALRGRIDLPQPRNSRLVLRLDPESHNCWSDCADDADTMQAAIARLASAVPTTEIDPSLLVSMAQVLERDGIVASAGGRAESGIIAKWEFREGQGNTTADTSGVLPEVPLSLSGDFSWLASWGVRFVDGKAQGGVTGSQKVFDRITGTGEYSIEAWVAPTNVSQEEAWIVGYAGGPDSRNMLLSQSLYNYEAFNRSSVTDDNAGAPPLTTGDDQELAQATLQHVVVTYDPVNGRRIYVNGSDSGQVDPAGGGLLNNWSEAYALVLGNTTANDNPWAGTLRMAAVYNRALSAGQVLQNYSVGVGQRYYLLFSISELLDREGQCHVTDGTDRTNYCYIAFEVSQFDDNSYLFKQPFFANLNPDATEVDFDLRGIRLGINGKLSPVGQAYVNVNARIDSAEAGELGRNLSSIGTVVPVENGAGGDSFFLAFDLLAGESGSADDGASKGYQRILTGAPEPDVGLRTFDAINATLSAITGVPTSSSTPSEVTGKTVAETFATVRRALPAVADFQAFMSSHQVAATQLAAAYCDALVQDSALREALFSPAFDFTRPVASPDIDWRNHIVAPLVDRATNSGLISDSDRNRVLDEVELLITDDRDLKPYIFSNGRWISDPDPAVHDKRDGLIYCRNDAPCPPSRTAEVVKAACTAILGSSVVMVM